MFWQKMTYIKRFFIHYKLFLTNKYCKITLWAFHYFCITLILRQIIFGDFRNAKFTISTHLEALNFDVYDFLHFMKAKIYQNNKIQRPINCKSGGFETPRFSKINFT